MKEITIVPTTRNTLSSSSQPQTQPQSQSSSSIKCVSPNVVAGSNKSYVVFEAIYYDNGANGVHNHSNQLVLAKVKSNHKTNDTKANANTNTTTKCDANVAQPILVTSVSSPLTSVLQCNNSTTSLSNNNNSNNISNNNGTIVKKPGIILLTQASLSKLLSANDLNVINNNSNINTANHAHIHQHDSNIRSKCNIAINSTNQKFTQINNQLTSVLMINSTSTIETTAGVVTLTSSTASNQLSSAPNRDENAKNTNQHQVID